MINVILRRKIAGCCCRDAIISLPKSSATQIVARTKMNVTSNEKNEFRPIAIIGNESMLHDSRGSMGHWFYLQKNLRTNCHLPALKRKFTTKSFIMGMNHDKSDLLSELNAMNDPLSQAEKKPLQLVNAIDRDYMSIDDVIQILNENLCEDLCVIKIDEDRTKFYYVDYFVIVSGRSLRHLKSMAFELCAKFKHKVREKRGKATAIVEGEDCNDWMVVDIGNVVVHFMTPEARELYELEKLWTLGPSFDDQLQVMMEKEKEFEMEDLNLPFRSKSISAKKLGRELSSDSSR